MLKARYISLAWLRIVPISTVSIAQVRILQRDKSNPAISVIVMFPGEDIVKEPVPGKGNTKQQQQQRSKTD